MAQPVLLYQERAERPPLADVEIEAALLAAVLYDNSQYDRISLNPDHFHDALHARIFAALSDEIQAGRRADGRSLAASLATTDPEAADYIRSLPDMMVSDDASPYARIVRRLHQRRVLVDIADDVVDRAIAADIDADPDEIASSAADRIFALQEDRTAGQGGPLAIAEGMNDTLQWLDDLHAGRVDPGLRTGLSDLDDLLGGLGAGKLAILAARPSMGKTALALRVARHTAQGQDNDGGRRVVAFFSFEMSNKELHLRLISERTGIPYFDMARPNAISPQARQEVVQAGLELRDLRLEIDDTSSLATPQIIARCRAIKRRRGRLDLIVIDHLGYIRALDQRAPQVERLGDITRALKGAAKQFGCAVLLLCQLNRGVEQRDDKRPLLSDLRESGQIEENADTVLMLYRPEYYLERSQPQRREGEDATKFDERFISWSMQYDEARNKAEVYVPKNRQGAVGSVSLYCNIATNTFDNLAGDRP